MRFEFACVTCAAGAFGALAANSTGGGFLGAEATGGTMRSNDVYLDNAGSLSYSLADHSISSGQPWGGVTSNYNSITVNAGRHGSGAPAQFFLRGLGPANVMGNNVNSDQFPSDLNFAVKGDLTMNVDSITVTCNDIFFGQGHTSNGWSSSNNWWMGGPNCVGGNSGSNPVTCACSNGALVKFETGDVSRFSVSITNRCGIISSRSGSWTAVTAAPGQKVGYSFSSASEEYTESEFMASLSAEFAAPLSFGDLGISAEASYSYVSQNTHSTSWSQTCEVTVPEGARLWQWTYVVDTNCGSNSLHSCYFFTLPIDTGSPCCLAGYQSSVRTQCTEAGKNMCGEDTTSSLRGSNGIR